VDFAHLMQAGSVSELADAAVKATALATRVEFVLLLSPPDDRGRFSAAKGYDHIRERPLSGFAMHGRAYPAIQEALVERRVLEVTDDPKPPDLEGLMDEMEAYESGTLLLLPILSGEALRAGLLLFSPFAQHRWSIEEKAQLGRLCSLLAERFAQLDQRSPLADDTAGGISRPAAAAGGAASPARAWSEPQPPAGQQSDEMLLVLQELAEARSQLALLAADQHAHASTLDQAAALRALSARLEQGLRSVSSYSSLLLDDIAGALTSVQRKYLERLHAGLARSQGLAQDLRDRLAPGSELLEDEGEWAELDACLQQVMARYTIALREHQLRLQLDLPERSPVLRAEPGVLEQVLDNLLANAVAVTPDGEDVTITAHVIRDAGSSYMLLDVADRGPGIATEHLGMVFEPQVSADAHRPAGIQDGGAGLPLVKRLCEAVGGRVWVDSRPGYGTTYTALLPLAPGEAGTPGRPMTSDG
jgi:signal transduction histidine kinase